MSLFHLFAVRFIHSFIDLLNHPSIHLFIHISTYSFTYTSVHLSMFSSSHQFIPHSIIYPPPIHLPTHSPTYFCTHLTTHPSIHSPPIYPSTPPTTCPLRDTGKNQHSPPWSPPGCRGRGGSPLLSGEMEWIERYYNPAAASWASSLLPSLNLRTHLHWLVLAVGVAGVYLWRYR